MAEFITPYVELVISTSAYAAGDALGAKSSFPRVPKRGTIMAVRVIDRDSEEANLDVVLFQQDIDGTSDNSAFAPSNAELEDCQGAVLVDTWKTFSTNSLGIVDNVGLPYYAPEGELFFQCVTRGTPTYTATDDVRIAVSILY